MSHECGDGGRRHHISLGRQTKAGTTADPLAEGILIRRRKPTITGDSVLEVLGVWSGHSYLVGGVMSKWPPIPATHMTDNVQFDIPAST